MKCMIAIITLGLLAGGELGAQHRSDERLISAALDAVHDNISGTAPSTVTRSIMGIVLDIKTWKRVALERIPLQMDGLNRSFAAQRGLSVDDLAGFLSCDAAGRNCILSDPAAIVVAFTVPEIEGADGSVEVSVYFQYESDLHHREYIVELNSSTGSWQVVSLIARLVT